MKTGPKPQTFEKVYDILHKRSYENENGCYVWLGGTMGDGYGHIRCDNETWYIHRLIYREFICREVPEVVMHTCDNPPCWNPDHLVGGTHADNVADKVQKKRHQFGETTWLVKLTEEAVKDIRVSELSPVELAKKYGVTRATIHHAINRQSWKHVE